MYNLLESGVQNRRYKNCIAHISHTARVKTFQSESIRLKYFVISFERNIVYNIFVSGGYLRVKYSDNPQCIGQN